MSGIIGHTLAAICAAKATAARKLTISPLLFRHWSSYLCGAYLGCDIQTLPEAICEDTGEEIGYGTVPIERSPITGGKVKPWTFELAGRRYSARDVHTMFYGRAHLVFGWSAGERQHTVPWDHLADYVAMTLEDALELFPPSQRQLAYIFGWLAHIVSDSLIKAVRPGLSMRLLDGLYTPRNRPIQDLVSYHELGRKQLGIDWPATLYDLADTPVEPIQLHFMRATRPRGALYANFANAWAPEYELLLRHVLSENRRYLRKYLKQLLAEYQLGMQDGQETCSATLSQQAGGLSYQQMVSAAEDAGLAATVGQVAEEICQLFEQVVNRIPTLMPMPDLAKPDWPELRGRWHVPNLGH